MGSGFAAAAFAAFAAFAPDVLVAFAGCRMRHELIWSRAGQRAMSSPPDPAAPAERTRNRVKRNATRPHVQGPGLAPACNPVTDPKNLCAMLLQQLTAHTPNQECSTPFFPPPPAHLKPAPGTNSVSPSLRRAPPCAPPTPHYRHADPQKRHYTAEASSQVLQPPRLFVVHCELPSSPQLGKTQHQGQSHDDLPRHCCGRHPKDRPTQVL